MIFKMMLRLILFVMVVALGASVPVAQASPALAPMRDGYLTGCTGEYFNNVSVSGAPAVVRGDAVISFFWPENTSPAAGVNVNNYSVRWTCNVNAPASANYTFNIVTDDGMNVIVDNNVILWAFYDQGPTSYSATVYLNAGAHTVRVEYYNKWNAGTAQVWSSLGSGVIAPTPVPVPVPQPIPGPVPVPQPVPSSGWQGQYFNNLTFSGAPTLVRTDPVLNLNWYEGSPGPGMQIDYFSVKWDSTQYVPATGNYTVSATSDDGVRVWIDGTLVIDGWYDHGPTTFTTVVALNAGAHAVHVEYYDRTLGAMIVVQIGGGSTPPPPPIPQPVGDVIVDDRGPGWQAGGVGGWIDVATGIGGHAFVSYSRLHSSFGYNWGRWYPTLPRAGNYEVFAYVPAGTANTLSARYWIAHGGRYNLAVRQQGYYANQWMPLGMYYFSATGGEYVSLADVTYECLYCRSVVFDAILFSPR